MANIRRLILVSLVFLAIPLSGCQKNSVYGTYSFEMGSDKGTHFGIALTLYETVSTPSERVSFASSDSSFYAPYLALDEGVVQRRFDFSFDNVSDLTSSSSALSGASSSSDSSDSSDSSLAASSDSSVASSSAASAGSDSLASDEESSSEAASSSNLSIKTQGLWSFYSDYPASSSASSSTSAVDDGSRPLRIEFTHFEQIDPVTKKSMDNADLFLPADITKAIFDIAIKGKIASIKIPVSSNDLLFKVLSVLGGDDPSELDGIHQVTLELTKQD